jgi:hypothetical protein
MKKPEIEFSFEHIKEIYTARIWHYSQLSIKERLDHGITENTYLVFLKGPYEFRPFEIYIGEDLEWHTKSTFVVDDEIVQIIGLAIHNKSM